MQLSFIHSLQGKRKPRKRSPRLGSLPAAISLAVRIRNRRNRDLAPLVATPPLPRIQFGFVPQIRPTPPHQFVFSASPTQATQRGFVLAAHKNSQNQPPSPPRPWRVPRSPASNLASFRKFAPRHPTNSFFPRVQPKLHSADLCSPRTSLQNQPSSPPDRGEFHAPTIPPTRFVFSTQTPPGI